MIGIGLVNLWLWLDGGGLPAVEVPPAVTGVGGRPLRRHFYDPILSARPGGGAIRAIRRTGRALDKRLREP